MSIKFYRARKQSDLEWVRGYVWQGANDTYIIPHNYGVNVDGDTNRLQASAFKVIPETLGQCTGKEDSKYNNIYVGDILESDINGTVKQYEVTFEDSSFGVKWTYEGVAHFAAFSSFDSNVKFTIIDNIHAITPEMVMQYAGSVNSQIAIGILKFMKSQYDTDTPGHSKYIQAITHAIQALNKTIEQNVDTTGDDEQDYYICPNCKASIASLDEDDSMLPAHCTECGQALKYGG